MSHGVYAYGYMKHIFQDDEYLSHPMGRPVVEDSSPRTLGGLFEEEQWRKEVRRAAYEDERREKEMARRREVRDEWKRKQAEASKPKEHVSDDEALRRLNMLIELLNTKQGE